MLSEHLTLGALIWLIFGLTYFIYSALSRHLRGPKFPPRSTVRIVFEERGASGNSLRNLITRMGGASRCLTVTVTTTELWITTFFPLTLFLGPYDLEHRIPIDDLLGVRQDGRMVRVDFRRSDGSPASIRLLLRDSAGFLRCFEQEKAA